ncbi:hypothetical protein Trichorick_01625 (plasmid) [Candidatus Trichorickettsia mobilis]|nr:hypothetical protein Trichorick_01625 [Candidatus Trichorickettsia mobilis]
MKAEKTALFLYRPIFYNLRLLSVKHNLNEIVLKNEIDNWYYSTHLQLKPIVNTLTYIEYTIYKDIIKKLAYSSHAEDLMTLAIAFKGIGDLRRFKGQITSEPQDCIEACIAYKYALALIEVQDQSSLYIKFLISSQALYEDIEKSLENLTSTISVQSNPNLLRSNTIRPLLKDLRKHVNTENQKILADFNYNLKNSQHSNTFNTEETSIQKIQYLYQKSIFPRIKEVLELLYRNSQDNLGIPPCKFVIIGLGSLAIEQITPYSDLEFAILTENDNYKNSNDLKIKNYFKNLTYLVYFQIANLGETIIPTSRYEIDLAHLVNQAVTLDLGGKVPLGRREKDKEYELIKTVEGMLLYLYNQNNSIEYIDKNLPYILEKSCFIYGDENLALEYQTRVKDFLFRTKDDLGYFYGQSRALRLLKSGTKELINGVLVEYKGDLEKFSPLIRKEGEPLNVKQEIYRTIERLIHSLAYLYNIDKGNVWEIIDQLTQEKIISPQGATNLQFAFSFALSFRLYIYSSQEAQRDEILINLSSNKNRTAKNQIYLPQEYMEEPNSLFKYFSIVLSFFYSVKEFCTLYPNLELEQKNKFFINNRFYEDSSICNGHLYFRLLQYHKAIASFKEALEKENTFKLELNLSKLFNAKNDISKVGKFLEHHLGLSKSFNQLPLQSNQELYNNLATYLEAFDKGYKSLYSDKGRSLHMLDNSSHFMEKVEAAIYYYIQDLELEEKKIAEDKIFRNNIEPLKLLVIEYFFVKNHIEAKKNAQQVVDTLNSHYNKLSLTTFLYVLTVASLKLTDYINTNSYIIHIKKNYKQGEVFQLHPILEPCFVGNASEIKSLDDINKLITLDEEMSSLLIGENVFNQSNTL